MAGSHSVCLTAFKKVDIISEEIDYYFLLCFVFVYKIIVIDFRLY